MGVLALINSLGESYNNEVINLVYLSIAKLLYYVCTGFPPCIGSASLSI